MQLDAKEKHGRLFLIYILLSCSPVIQYLCRYQKRDTEYNLAYWRRILNLLELALSFESWVCSGVHRKEDVTGEDGSPETSKAHRNIRLFLHRLKTWCPTGTNAGFRTTKFHQCLHFPRYIYEHGSMLNCDGNRPESMAVRNLKDPASHTQGRHNTLSYQTATHYLNQLTVLDAQRIITEQSSNTVHWSEEFQYINNNSNENDSTAGVLESCSFEATCTGTKFQIEYWYDNDNDSHNVQLVWKNKGEIPVEGFDNTVLEYVSDRLFNPKDGGRIADSCIPGFTVLKTSDGRSFHAHPYERNERPKHDWVFIRWSEFDDPIPAQIEMFLDTRQSDIRYDNWHVIHPDQLDDGTNDVPVLHSNKVLMKSIYAVVWSAESNICPRNELSKYHLPLSLGYRVKMEPFKRIVEVSSFEQKCFAYMNTAGCEAPYDSTAIVCRSAQEWPNIFLDGCRQI
jgi:hypothetical protein